VLIPVIQLQSLSLLFSLKMTRQVWTDSSDEGSKVGNEKGGRSENETPGVDSSDKCSSVGSRVEGDQDSEVQEPAEMHPAILSGDFGRVIGLKAQRKVTDSEKFFLLKHHFVPRKGYQFPSCTFSGRQRHFQSSWLGKYSGLVYSESEDGGYCKFCVLFATCEPPVRELGVLVTRPLTNFKKAIDKLNEHFCSQRRKSHQASVERGMAFCAVMEKPALAIDQQLSSNRAKLVAENQLKLQSIAATVISVGDKLMPFEVIVMTDLL